MGNRILYIRRKYNHAVKMDILESKSCDSKENSLLDLTNKERTIWRNDLEDILLRRFFFVPSYEIYGGVGGLYDYGPSGSELLQNVQQLWRKNFILKENQQEVHCAAITPEIVLKTSGHVDRFTDFMVVDLKTGEFYRADKLIEEEISKKLDIYIDNNDEKNINKLNKILTDVGVANEIELENIIKEYNICSPEGNPVGNVRKFNLMFQTSIGPTGKSIGYLRPETAQGIFVNFKRLYEYANRKLPFGVAQIGLAYRNEIAPRSGLLRVREFLLAEIEYFINPNSTKHSKFTSVSSTILQFLPRELQESQQDNEDKNQTMEILSLIEAFNKKYISNEILGYFQCRTYNFQLQCGINSSCIRFRQHRKDEMAHYAQDCWDAEIYTTYGWIECVGHADRSAYDLNVHSKVSNVDLTANEILPEPITIEKLYILPNLKRIGKKCGAQTQKVVEYLRTINDNEIKDIENKIINNESIQLPPLEELQIYLEKDDLIIEKKEEKTSITTFTPSVIEPSFGIGRIVYAILEHSLLKRIQDERKIQRLKPSIAPKKVGIYTVINNIPYQNIITTLCEECIEYNLSYIDDTSKASIGKKYSRGDEIGIPYAISIDSDTISKNLVTIRERDTCQQIQVNLNEAVHIVSQQCKNVDWGTMLHRYPLFSSTTSP